MKNKIKRVMLTCFIAIAVLLLSSCNFVNNDKDVNQGASSTIANTNTDEALNPFKGRWEGIFDTDTTKNVDITLDIDPNQTGKEVLLSSSVWDSYFYTVNWTVDNDEITLSLNSEEHRAIIKLKLIDNTLSGTYTQYGVTYDLKLSKSSDTPSFGEFYRKASQISTEERKEQLLEFAEYGTDNIAIPFTYELGNRSKCENIIKEYDLDKITKNSKGENLQDVDLMLALLNWACDNFQHDGTSGLPDNRDINAVIEFAKGNNNSVNCRGLSIILAEMCRVYDIPAKHITCMPKEASFDDCHVVVQAYSKEREQWIMLDPTNRLTLQDEAGKYLDLESFREALISDTVAVPNKEADHNGDGFYIQNYRDYMTKNTFRFSSATKFYYGADEGYENNLSNMLIPVGYTDDKGDVTTVSPKAFWAKP